MNKKISEYDQIIARNNSDWLLIEEAATGKYKRIKISDFIIGLSSGSSNSVDLNYLSSGDANGLFYWLGTNGKTTVFSNPHTDGKLFISASSVGAGTVAQLCDRQDSQFFTDSVNGSWIKITLPVGKNLKLNYYSIKTRNQSSGYHPKNWKLQGSNDDSTWIDLDNQVNNTTLTNNSQWLSLPVNTNTAYRHWRILVTGFNSSNFYHLVLGEVEFYGQLNY